MDASLHKTICTHVAFKIHHCLICANRASSYHVHVTVRVVLTDQWLPLGRSSNFAVCSITACNNKFEEIDMSEMFHCPLRIQVFFWSEVNLSFLQQLISLLF